ncbi:MAG: helix-turn-helix transcriptional regulator [Terracidiphilus sp.]|nr:helix-turn-helix transcriptional regulator [Terracidiphilus sp.]
MRSAIFLQPEFNGNSTVDSAQQLFSKNLRANHLSCCRHAVALHGDKNIPIPIIVKGKFVPVTQEKLEGNALAETIRRVRKKEVLGITQAELAEKLGTSQSNVAKWERGDYRPSPEQLVHLARLLGGRVESLFFYKEAGVSDEYFEKPNAPMPKVLIDSDDSEANHGRSPSPRLPEGFHLPDSVHPVPVLKYLSQLGEPNPIVDYTLSLPVEWLPRRGVIQAVRFENTISRYIEKEVIAIVDVSRKDPDRLYKGVIAARTPTGIEPMALQKDRETYFLVPIGEPSSSILEPLQSSGNWSIVGKILRWIGEAPPGRFRKVGDRK